MDSTPPPDTAVAELAALTRRLPPSCGPVRLVAVDGHAGSGKSTFADRLARALGGAPVLHLDDLATHEEFFGWTDRLRRQLLDPLARGERARYEPYDWNLRRFGAARSVEPAPVILIEGVGAGRRELRSCLALLVWMELDAEASWARGRSRDGIGLSGFWDDWTAAEMCHFAEDPSRPFADALVRQVREGYEWLPGPDSTPSEARPLTHRDDLTPPH
ncbi:hypothetical protein DT019_19265 [Streptomyces sp. SDr-06]|uniref:uridine kinase family protein n=1 Tax=Streptomyces sp. SDr-06 TaxID=2267702 RepID=UPI000DE938B1|nr:hypothetical protein [Streptomyces sp. SDr-06]RCH67206.1 hypothetical protein DT019_19265 [Streptomyces sp. SDr-06]